MMSGTDDGGAGHTEGVVVTVVSATAGRTCCGVSNAVASGNSSVGSDVGTGVVEDNESDLAASLRISFRQSGDDTETKDEADELELESDELELEDERREDILAMRNTAKVKRRLLNTRRYFFFILLFLRNRGEYAEAACWAEMLMRSVAFLSRLDPDWPQGMVSCGN